jgi:hypothetical protein
MSGRDFDLHRHRRLGLDPVDRLAVLDDLPRLDTEIHQAGGHRTGKGISDSGFGLIKETNNMQFL